MAKSLSESSSKEEVMNFLDDNDFGFLKNEYEGENYYVFLSFSIL